jgi:hypothetical protein
MIRHKLIGTVAYMGGTMSTPEAFTWSWGQLTRHTEAVICGPHEHIHLARSTVSLHDWGRNQILGDLRGDWLFMLDNDVAFEPDVCARLLATANRYDLDVVTGIYSYKTAPHYPVLYLHNYDTQRNEVVADWDRASEVFRVDSAGAGCLFVRRHVFQQITRELKVNPFDRIGRKGEDHSFFERLRELGIPAWCAWKIEVQHLAVTGIQTSVHFKPTREPDHFYQGEGFDRAGAAVKAPPQLGEKEQLAL